MADEPAKTTPTEPTAPEPQKKRALFTLRTFFSAAIYGGFGAVAGYYLGKWGDNPHSTVARRVMTVVGGLGGAILAAFTSTKTGRRENEAAERERRAAARAVAPSEFAPPPSPKEPVKPEPHVEAVQRDGMLAETAQQLSV